MTAQEKYDRRRAWLEKVLEERPDLRWPREELKYMTVDDFEEYPNKRTLTIDMGRRGVCDAAVACEIAYNGSGGFYDP